MKSAKKGAVVGQEFWYNAEDPDGFIGPFQWNTCKGIEDEVSYRLVKITAALRSLLLCYTL